MKTQAERLSWLIARMGLNKTQFGKFIGKDYKAVNKWTSGRPMDPSKLVLIAERSDVSLDWLMRGIGPEPTPRRVDPRLLGGDVVEESHVERDTVVSFAAWLATPMGRTATGDEMRGLLARAASTGAVDYDLELRALRVPASKRPREPEAIGANKILEPSP